MSQLRTEGEQAVAVRERLTVDLVANGDDRDWMYQTPVIEAYPGVDSVWNDLQQFAWKATA